MSRLQYTVRVRDIDLDAWADEYGIDRGDKAFDDFNEFVSQQLTAFLSGHLHGQGYSEVKVDTWFSVGSK